MILVMGQIVIGALDFGLSNALAQTTAVCSNTPNTGERIECTESAGSTTTIDIDLEGYSVDTTEVGEHGIYAKHEGDGGCSGRNRVAEAVGEIGCRVRG